MKIFLFFLLICPPLYIAPAYGGDLYRLLGVLPGHSSEELTRAFQLIKFRIHPHRHGGSLEAKERFQELEEAYNSLQDPAFRTKYDSHLRSSEKEIQEEPNLYKVLGVLSDSSPAELTGAYRKIRGQIHPDRHGKGHPANEKLANERLKELQRAYKTLLDPALRASHDRRLKRTGYVLAYDTVRREGVTVSPEQKPGRKPKTADSPQFYSATKRETDEAVTVEFDIFNKEVFRLARDLEKAGGEEDLKEAIEWYRLLAGESHIEAIKRLAPLLERVDMEEAIYRYRQAEALAGPDDDSAWVWAFRQAQFYQEGFRVKGKEIFPKDSARAAELYERAVQLGADPRDIAREYEKTGDYDGALKYWSVDPDASDKKTLKEEGQKEGLARFVWYKPSSVSVRRRSPNPSLKKNKEIHFAVTHQDGLKNTHKEKEEKTVGMVRLLMEKGSDINARGEGGWTPLIFAVNRTYFRLIWLLIDRGADVNVPDKDGDTPLHNILMNSDGFQFYIQFAFIGYDNQAGVNRRMTRRFRQNLNKDERETLRQIIFSLVEKTDLNLRNKKNQLPLHIAVEWNRPEAAGWILQRMRDRKILTSEEKQYLMNSAVQRGYTQVVRFLAEAPVKGKPASAGIKVTSSLRRFVNRCKELW